jgi:PKD repeat protein
MISKHHIQKLSMTVVTAILLIIVALAVLPDPQGASERASPSPTLTLTAHTDKQTYLLRQRVILSGNMLLDGQPATNLVVLVQINGPLAPMVFRTLQIGTPNQTWPITITDVFLRNSTNDLVNTVKTKEMVQAGISLYNWQLTNRTVYATITVFDANLSPIATNSFIQTINAGQPATSSFFFWVPSSACAGRALIVGNAYSAEPETGASALSPEKVAYYCLSKTEKGLLEYPSVPLPPPQNTPGTYTTNITLPPDPTVGTYSVYVKGQASVTAIYSTTTSFAAQASTGYPPQASFAFWPAKPYVNMTVNFDASSSTPEGFADSITSYKWTFGDGTLPTTRTTPTITHNYLTASTFTATLNVTDSEGLWSTTSKPIKIYPEFGPTANFTWNPIFPIKKDNVTFSASSSTTGWYAKKAYFSPITSYTWNFSDGTGTFVRTTPTITHNFTTPGNYTVKLTVGDADGRTSTKSYIIPVQNITLKTYDVNGDHKIDLKDVYAVGKAYGSTPGSPRWDPRCDFDKNNLVDLKDYYGVCKHYGKDP